MSWKTLRIEEFADVIGGGTPSTKNDAFWNGNIPWIGPRDLSGWNYKFIEKGERNISNEGLINSSTKLLPEKTVLMTSRAPIGYVAIAKNKICTNQGFQNLICKDNIAIPNFVYYLIKGNIDKIKSIASGATFPEISKTKLKGIKLLLPPLEIQKRIADILSNYDDLIENNLKRIKLLEQAAQNIYKEWFVNMRFPGHENTPIDQQTGLPDNWKKDKIDNILKLIHGFAFKAKDFVNEPTNIMVIRMGNFNEHGDLQLDKNVKYLPSGTEIKERYKLFTGDLLMVLSDVTRDGRIIGNVGILPQKGIAYALNQRVANLKLQEPKLKYYFLYSLNSYNFKEYCKSRANGATVLNLKTKDILNYEITIPSKKLIDLFLNQVTPINQLKENLLTEIEKLKSARDILLPRLMNQTIEV